jgi:hypothetical protein
VLHFPRPGHDLRGRGDALSGHVAVWGSRARTQQATPMVSRGCAGRRSRFADIPPLRARVCTSRGFEAVVIKARPNALRSASATLGDSAEGGSGSRTCGWGRQPSTKDPPERRPAQRPELILSSFSRSENSRAGQCWTLSIFACAEASPSRRGRA